MPEFRVKVKISATVFLSVKGMHAADVASRLIEEIEHSISGRMGVLVEDVDVDEYHIQCAETILPGEKS